MATAQTNEDVRQRCFDVFDERTKDRFVEHSASEAVVAEDGPVPARLRGGETDGTAAEGIEPAATETP